MLAAAVQRIWADPRLSERMGRAARDYVTAEYGDANFMSSLMDAYGEVLGSNPARNRRKRDSRPEGRKRESSQHSRDMVGR
jgi:hypothetical protein